jgi:cysteine desulfurase
VPYFDHNATTPLSPAARAAWLKAQDESWHNASSPYRAAARARLRLDGHRGALALLLGGVAEHYVFTAGATEGAHAVLRYWAQVLPQDAWIAVNPTEHPCVLAATASAFPGRWRPLALTPDGVVTPEVARQALRAGARGLVVMAANNETGVLQPWSELATLAQEAGVPFLCDASQWLGKLAAGGLGAMHAWVLGAGHKFGAPKGTGFLKLPPSAVDFVIYPGSAQEHGHRGGTEDLAGIAALCAALAEAEQTQVVWEADRVAARDVWEASLSAEPVLAGLRIVGTADARTERLWNTSLLLVPPIAAALGGVVADQHRWVTLLDKCDVQTSPGAACAIGKAGPSHVLAALGIAPEVATRSVRISAGWGTTAADYAAARAALIATARQLE